MSEHRSKVGSGQPNAKPEPTGSWSGNGANHENALGALDESAEKPQASVSTAPDEAPEDGSAFVAELVRAMQTIVDVERVRIAENSERRRQAQIDLIRARDTSEVDRLRTVAADDTKAIKTWVDVETKRIQREGEMRQKEVRDDLEAHLSTHRSTFDGAIERLESTIASYRSEVAAYFSSLDRETDLVLIAQQAARHPVFPTLAPVPETVAASMAAAADAELPSSDMPSADAGDAATGTAVAEGTEPKVVGVMDPQAAAEPETSPVLVPAGVSDRVEQDAEEMVEGTPPTSLFKTVPALRPMSSWLRRDTSEDASNREG